MAHISIHGQRPVYADLAHLAVDRAPGNTEVPRHLRNVAFEQPGETFAAGEALHSVETEKTATDIEAPSAGTLLEVFVNEGADAEAGTPVCRIEVEQLR